MLFCNSQHKYKTLCSYGGTCEKKPLWYWQDEKRGIFYLDPSEKYSHGHHVIKLRLPEAQRIKVCVLFVVCQEPFQQITHSHCAVHVEHNSHVTQEDHNDVQDIPEALEVFQLVFFDLQNLLDGVVDDKENEDSLTRHHKVIKGGDITDEFHCSEVEGRDAATCSRVLKQESGEREKELSSSPFLSPPPPPPPPPQESTAQ